MKNPRLLTIIGARPQFVKAAAVSQALRDVAINVTEEIVHTGQHHDQNMSEVFFEELGIPAPAVNLGIRGGGHGEMTGRMLEALEKEMLACQPAMVLVYGDTNSTLAGALAAAKLHIPVAHVEAGLRSFNRRMPEEINRVLTDHVSALLFAPTKAAMQNMEREGLSPLAHHVGDVMYDAALTFGAVAGKRSILLGQLSLTPKSYALATVHRAENTDDPAKLAGIVDGLERITGSCRVVLPLHPRTRGRLGELGLTMKRVEVIDPVSYLDMICLERNARVILTDSGGIQKEAYFHGVPCVTLREETEWLETVDAGWNQLAGADAERMFRAFQLAVPGRPIDEYGGGVAAQRIATLLAQHIS